MQGDMADFFDDMPDEGRDLYQAFDQAEETARVAYHYEVDPSFFQVVTGGRWNVYSCSLWGEAETLTQAQEDKLDKFAQLMALKPGQRVLDVGCGWGGPLVYLCKKYGVVGHGITISPMAIPVAEKRAKEHGVDAKFEVLNWRDLEGESVYDAIYSDEVIVHFNDLQRFFNHAHRLLKPAGMMVNKELHFTHSKHKHAHDKLSQHINKVYGYTGNYRTLRDELALMDDEGFALEEVFDIPIGQYQKTIRDHWLKNLKENREFLTSLTNEKHYRDFHLYLKGILHIFQAEVFGLHIVASRKL